MFHHFESSFIPLEELLALKKREELDSKRKGLSRFGNRFFGWVCPTFKEMGKGGIKKEVKLDNNKKRERPLTKHSPNLPKLGR